MADERQPETDPLKAPAREGRLQSPGREANAAEPLDTSQNGAGAERYPAVNQQDAVERTGRTGTQPAPQGGETRSFEDDGQGGAQDPSEEAPRQDGFRGASGDPAEGPR